MRRKPGTEARAETGRGARKVREGVVLSSKMDRTAVVAVVDRVRHPKYAKFVLRTKLGHDLAVLEPEGSGGASLRFFGSDGSVRLRVAVLQDEPRIELFDRGGAVIAQVPAPPPEVPAPPSVP